MKKYYERPSLAIEETKALELICASETITSNLGINYGGVDENGNMTVESRRQYLWDEAEAEEDW